MLAEIAKGLIFTKKKQMTVSSTLISGYKKIDADSKKEKNENTKYICQIFKIHMPLLKNKMT